MGTRVGIIKNFKYGFRISLRFNKLYRKIFRSRDDQIAGISNSHKKVIPKITGKCGNKNYASEQIFIPIPEILGISGNGNENPKQGWAPGRVFPVELLPVLSYFLSF